MADVILVVEADKSSKHYSGESAWTKRTVIPENLIRSSPCIYGLGVGKTGGGSQTVVSDAAGSEITALKMYSEDQKDGKMDHDRGEKNVSF